MAAGFSMGIPAVRSIITETSSEASARAAALTTGALGTVRFAVFFFFFFVAGVLRVVLDWESR
jgi:hypothetical protein